MLALSLRLWPAALALALAGGLWLHGRSTGAAQCEAAHAAALADARAIADAATRQLAAKEALRLAAEAERERLSRELEDAAYADPAVNPSCLSADRVRRLNQR